MIEPDEDGPDIDGGQEQSDKCISKFSQYANIVDVQQVHDAQLGEIDRNERPKKKFVKKRKKRTRKKNVKSIIKGISKI